MTETEKIEVIYKETAFSKVYIRRHLEKCDWDIWQAKLSISEELNQRFIKLQQRKEADKNE